jgi:hypothetical protein
MFFFRLKANKETVRIGEPVQVEVEACTKIDMDNIIRQKELELVNVNAAFSRLKISDEVYIEEIGKEQFACRSLDKIEIYPFEADTLFISSLPFLILTKYYSDTLQVESNSLGIPVLDIDKNQETVSIDISKLDCRLIEDSSANNGTVKLEVNIKGKGFPGFYKLDAESFGDNIEFTSEVAEYYFGDQEDGINSIKLIYTLIFKEKGKYKFHPRCSYWNSTKKTSSVMFGEEITIDIPKKAKTKRNDKANLNDIVVLVDLSSSMISQDYLPDRLGFIKNTLKKIVDKKINNFFE